MRRHMRSLTFLLAFLVWQGAALGSGPDKDERNTATGAGLGKVHTNDVYRPFLINNVFNYYANNGSGSYNKYSTDNEGFEFYKGGGKHTVFQDGIVWGGFHKGRSDPKVGGSVYRQGLQAGPILTPGTATSDPVAADTADPKHRIYRVRPDVNPRTGFTGVQTMLQNEEEKLISRFESTTAREIYDQYVKDWNEWPADLGAPYDDRDGNGTYSPAYDIPGVPGADQTLWYAANDMSEFRVVNLAGSPPIGLEMQRTIWGYKRSGNPGNIIFASTILINKSGAPIDSMFLVQWCDPDLGEPGDDLVGCDTLRNLGYVYNSRVDMTYGAVVPAVGFTLLQGPMVPSPGDTATLKGTSRPGYKNLPMTTFVFFTSGNAVYRDPIQGLGGDIQWYRLMRGLTAADGAPFIDPLTGQPARFVFPGDPVTGTGWLDGAGQGGIPPADRRLVIVTGPFTMAAGDTQELVVANLGGLGADRLSSITALRSVTDVARTVYENRFHIAEAPPAPTVRGTGLDGRVILSWGYPVSVERTERTVDQGYRFEGYNVYELPGPTFERPVLLQTFDLENGVKYIIDTVYDAESQFHLTTVRQRGSDHGVLRALRIDSSHVTGRRMVNGTTYYFAVTAYSYNPNPVSLIGTHSLESVPVIVAVTPQGVTPGTRYAATEGDTLTVTLVTSPGNPASEGAAEVRVIDPTLLNGHEYAVTFTAANRSPATWSLVDVTINKEIVSGQPQAEWLPSWYGGYFNAQGLIIDGLSVSVAGPPPGISTWGFRGTRRWTWTDGRGMHLEHFGNADSTSNGADTAGGTIGNAFEHFFSGGVGPERMRKVEIRLAAGDSSWSLTQPTDPNVSRGYRYLANAASEPARPEFAPFIVNKSAGFAYQGYSYSVPFSAWDVDASPPRRLAVGHLENNVPDGRVDGRWWPKVGASVGGNDNTVETGPREWWFIFDSPYGETPDPALTVDIFTTQVPMMYLGTHTRRTGGNPASGDAFVLTPARVNTPAHRYTFKAPQNTLGNSTLAREDINLINVFPNPYFGINPLERSVQEHYVTFTHLPDKAVVRIFTLAGTLVRSLVKNTPGQFLRWDLMTDRGRAVSSGMFIIHITIPDLGVTRVLKLAVIPRQ